MKETQKPVKLPYLDYECRVGDRVQFLSITHARLEGVLAEWLDDVVAVVRLDDGTLVSVKC